MSDYTPVGDLASVSICLVMLVLTRFSIVRNSRSFRIFISIVVVLIVAANADVLYHVLAETGTQGSIQWAYAMRIIFHGLLFLIYVLFAFYIGEAVHMNRKPKLAVRIISIIICGLVIGSEVYQTLNGRGLRITPAGTEFKGADIFLSGYIMFAVLMVAMMIAVSRSLFRNIMKAFFGTIVISFLILLLQMFFKQSSYTVLTFVYPVMGMFYLMHSNPYDAKMGALERVTLAERVRANYEKNLDFVYMSLYMKAFAEEGKETPDEIRTHVRRFTEKVFKDAALIRISTGFYVLMFLKKKNPDYTERIQKALEVFRKEYEYFKYDYKVVYGSNIDQVSRRNKYIDLIISIHQRMDENTIHLVNEEDVRILERTEYILDELQDIYHKKDPVDPRVLVYCQPVKNVRTGKYDTAEALMRIRLEQTGMVFPNEFIPLAEKYGYVHTLTGIILNKTCRIIKELMDTGYQFRRISINVSVIELSDDNFCNDFIRIVRENGVPSDKIAIELTESQSESDFLMMKKKIAELKEMGINFYLDDFGTGYSNMERIMELPFDIIKFDRSLVLASDESEKSRRIVVGLSNIFSEMNYSVLFEGVEVPEEEKMCIAMNASYLQGFKYSKPIPIEELTQYFEKQGLSH